MTEMSLGHFGATRVVRLPGSTKGRSSPFVARGARCIITKAHFSMPNSCRSKSIPVGACGGGFGTRVDFVDISGRANKVSVTFRLHLPKIGFSLSRNKGKGSRN